MRRLAMLGVVWWIVLIPTGALGCQAIQVPTERQALRASADVYATTVMLLAEYRRAGFIDDEATERISTAMRLARAALNEWYAAVKEDRPVSEAVSNFNRQLQVLLDEKLAADRRRVK